MGEKKCLSCTNFRRMFFIENITFYLFRQEFYALWSKSGNINLSAIPSRLDMLMRDLNLIKWIWDIFWSLWVILSLRNNAFFSKINKIIYCLKICLWSLQNNLRIDIFLQQLLGGMYSLSNCLQTAVSHSFAHTHV